jgi:DNA-binding transcriptional ArsR family regulator
LKKYDGLLCVVEIAEVLEENCSAISSHLAILWAVKLVVREDYASYAYYRLSEGVLEQYQHLLERL